MHFFRCMTKPPDRDSACLRALLLSVGVFLAVGSILAQAAQAGLCRAVREVHNGDLCHGKENTHRKKQSPQTRAVAVWGLCHAAILLRSTESCS